jgi:hypothetical protein
MGTEGGMAHWFLRPVLFQCRASIQALVSGFIILVGILLKLGGYGLLHVLLAVAHLSMNHGGCGPSLEPKQETGTFHHKVLGCHHL